MKAITLWQPWASLVAHELKHFETRSWATNYRGPLAIHAAKRPPEKMARFEQPLLDVGYADWNELPRGCVVAISSLWEVQRTEDMRWEGFWKQSIREQELQFGDFSPGRYAWRLSGTVLLDCIPARGHQGIWNWTPPPQVAQMLEAA